MTNSTTTTPDPHTVLALPVKSSCDGVPTVGAYLGLLLACVIRDEHVGDYWPYEVYPPLIRAGLVSGTFDENGELDFDSADIKSADEILCAAGLAALSGTSGTTPDGTDDVSDGYHTFGELYEHRRALTAALAKATPGSWRSKNHHPEDDPMFDGCFIVGVPTPGGPITYHYKLAHWDDFAAVPELEHAPRWDGAPPSATVDRLLAWAKAEGEPDA